jgi:hypothetical protein
MNETERLKRKLASKDRTIERLSVQIITFKSKIVCLTQSLEYHQERMEDEHMERCRGDVEYEAAVNGVYVWFDDKSKDNNREFMLSNFTKRELSG